MLKVVNLIYLEFISLIKLKLIQFIKIFHSILKHQ